MATLAEIRPAAPHRIYDLVREAGIDVSEWATGKGGTRKAAVNPKPSQQPSRRRRVP